MIVDLSKSPSKMSAKEIKALYAAARNVATYKLACTKRIKNPDEAIRHISAMFHGQTREAFGVIYLDSQHNVIGTKILFEGTINEAYVYPRVVVEGVLEAGASAIIVFHNHTSGTCEPSNADTSLTFKLRDALSLVDVKLLDHIIIGITTLSFSERGLI